MIHPARHNTFTRGVTLFETLIYIFIFSLLMTGALATSFWTAETSARTARLALIESEADFVLRKIDWAATGSTITAPSSNTTGTTLTFSRAGETYSFSHSGTELLFTLNGGTPTPLTTNNVSVSSFSATHVEEAGVVPAAASTTIIMNGKTYGPKIHYVR